MTEGNNLRKSQRRPSEITIVFTPNSFMNHSRICCDPVSKLCYGWLAEKVCSSLLVEPKRSRPRTHRQCQNYMFVDERTNLRNGASKPRNLFCNSDDIVVPSC
jgi:hypothetical protein